MARFAASAPRAVPGQLLVRYKEATSLQFATAKSRLQSLGVTTLIQLPDRRTVLLGLPDIAEPAQLQAMLSEDPEIDRVEPNFIRRVRDAMPNDPDFADQWGLYSSGQANFVTTDGSYASIAGADMNLPAAWDSNGDGTPDRTGDGSVIVAVIDDAIETTHPDLAGNMVQGRDLANNDDDPSPDNPLLEHGTLVTGALGATGNNGIGVAGVVWNVKILPLKVGSVQNDQVVLDNASIIAAYDYAHTHGAKIVNASFGGPDYSQIEHDAIQALADSGVLLVTSAGNFNSNLDDSVASYPANYDLPNIVSAAASNRQDNIASFSQYGPISVDVAAPGLQIVTTAINGGYSEPNNCPTTGSCGVSGTSFASPYTAGIAALTAMTYPAADFRELKARLIEGAEPGADNGDAGALTAGGRVDAANSLALTQRPSLVIRSVSFDNASHRLEPGTTVNVTVTLENLWQPASDVTATLSASSGLIAVTQNTDHVSTLSQGSRADLHFTLAVGSETGTYRNQDFTLSLTANSGQYLAQRHFHAELASLQAGEIAVSRLTTGLHDDFHTWSFTLGSAPGPAKRLVVCSKAGNDIDLLVRRGAPAQYDIDLGAPPEDDPTYFYLADNPSTTSGTSPEGLGAGGNEIVSFSNPAAGTYYVTVVNYDLIDHQPYSLVALLEADDRSPAGITSPGCAVASGTSAGTGGGGGSLDLTGTLLLLVSGWLRQGRRHRAKGNASR